MIRKTLSVNRVKEGAMRGQALTAEQYAKYSKGHQRLLTTISVTVAYCLGVGILDKFVSLEPFGFYITLGGFAVVGIAIWGMAGFRCPVCRSTPRAKSLGFSPSEVTYSSMVALFPKKCSFCGVRFEHEHPKSEA